MILAKTFVLIKLTDSEQQLQDASVVLKQFPNCNVVDMTMY